MCTSSANSKEINDCNFFSNARYNIINSSDKMLKTEFDITLAVNTWSISPNILQEKSAHFTTDSTDITDETLDSKNMLHITQVAVWQTGPGSLSSLKILKYRKQQHLDFPLVVSPLITLSVLMRLTSWLRKSEEEPGSAVSS